MAKHLFACEMLLSFLLVFLAYFNSHRNLRSKGMLCTVLLAGALLFFEVWSIRIGNTVFAGCRWVLSSNLAFVINKGIVLALSIRSGLRWKHRSPQAHILFTASQPEAVPAGEAAVNWQRLNRRYGGEGDRAWQGALSESSDPVTFHHEWSHREPACVDEYGLSDSTLQTTSILHFPKGTKVLCPVQLLLTKRQTRAITGYAFPVNTQLVTNKEEEEFIEGLVSSISLMTVSVSWMKYICRSSRNEVLNGAPVIDQSYSREWSVSPALDQMSRRNDALFDLSQFAISNEGFWTGIPLAALAILESIPVFVAVIQSDKRSRNRGTLQVATLGGETFNVPGRASDGKEVIAEEIRKLRNLTADVTITLVIQRSKKDGKLLTASEKVAKNRKYFSNPSE